MVRIRSALLLPALVHAARVPRGQRGHIEADESLVEEDAQVSQNSGCRRRRCQSPAPPPADEGGESAESAGDSGRRRSHYFNDHQADDDRRRRAPPPPLDEDAQRLGPQCQRFLDRQKFAGPMALREHLSHYEELHRSGRSYDWEMPCPINNTAQELFHPNPRPNIPGASDTTEMACQFGSITMQTTYKTYNDERGRVQRQSPLEAGTCCGVKPHFNWVIGTCEKFHPEGQFCAALPDCAKTGTPKINYLATYQYNGEEFVLMDDSTVGDLSTHGVTGNYHEGTGWISQNMSWEWRNGDWTTKYAPWAKGRGVDGPRGITPPGGLWVMSVENFYYGALYMLAQVNLNLEGHHQPTDTNCWLWELDPVEGSVGWHSPSEPGPGNLNMLYGTNNAQTSGCMPLTYTAKQANGMRGEFFSPQMFKPYCDENPTTPGCEPWNHKIDWSGGKPGSQRFENLWDQPYVFAVVLDQKGSWTYRWIPEADGSTGWPGVFRHSAARTIVNRPRAVTDPEGLDTDVRGHVKEALILQAGLTSEESCLRSSGEEVNWAFGSEALGSMAFELGESGSGRFEGAQNWWNHFGDTQQYQGYPITIMGIDKEIIRSVPLTCNTPETWTCDCVQGPKETDPEVLRARSEEYQVNRHEEHRRERAEGHGHHHH